MRREKIYLLEISRALLLSANILQWCWGGAILTTTYLINRMPSQTLGFKTPFQKLKEVFPHTRLFAQVPSKIFGCTAFVQDHQLNRSKLDSNAIKCILLGYAPSQKGYKCYSPTTKKKNSILT